MLEPPKFLDQLLAEMEQDGSAGVAPPVVRSVKNRRKDKNTLLIVALAAALLVNLALVLMMFTVLRDRSAEQPAEEADVTSQPANEREGGRSVTTETASGRLPKEAGVGSPATIQSTAEASMPAIPMPFGIAKLELCREVRGFAEYDLIPDIPLLPHHVAQIQAYIEVAHPRPEPREDGRYVYYMTVATRLYPAGDPFAEPLIDKAVSLVENGNSPRDDFHAVQPLQVNRRVGPGLYTLLVRVTDQISGETVRKETTFRVHAPQP